MTRPPVCASENKLPIYGPVWLQFAKKYGMLFDREWLKCTICAVGPAQIFHTLSRKRQGVDTFSRVNAEVPRSCGLYLVGRPEFARKTTEKTEENRKGVLCL